MEMLWNIYWIPLKFALHILWISIIGMTPVSIFIYLFNLISSRMKDNIVPFN